MKKFFHPPKQFFVIEQKDKENNKLKCCLKKEGNTIA